LLADALDRHLVKLLLFESAGLVLFAEAKNFFVFQLVFREIGYLDDAVGILKLGRDRFEYFHYVLEVLVAHQLLLHHVEDGQGNSE
jgi:hypothetical protein